MCDTDSDIEKKRKRSDRSSVSDIEIDSPLSKNEKKRQRAEKTAEMEEIRKELKLINVTLSKVITKEDPYLENIIKTTFNHMKEEFLQSISKRLDTLEHSLFEKGKENDALNEKVKELYEKVDEKESQNQQLKREV